MILIVKTVIEEMSFHPKIQDDQIVLGIQGIL